MAKQKQLNVALIGYRFMGAAHSNAYLNVDKFFKLPAKAHMKVIVGRKGSSKELEATAKTWGWEEVSRDYKKVLERDDIDIVDIVTPNNTHAEIAVAAAKAGKIVFCEKPLAMDVAECKKVVDAVKKSRKPSLVWFNYRFVPAVSLAKQILDEGRLGTIYHMRAHYLQDWIMDPDFPLVWRLKKEVSGSGAHGDLNAHIIDMARFLVGDF
ncbi:MAG: Gfo/Idh/MocA family protein, partial [Planctomycetota bacterium]